MTQDSESVNWVASQAGEGPLGLARADNAWANTRLLRLQVAHAVCMQQSCFQILLVSSYLVLGH